MSITNKQLLDHIRKLASGDFDVPLLITTKDVGIGTLDKLGLTGDSVKLIKQAAIAAIAAAGTGTASSPDVTMQAPSNASGNNGAITNHDNGDQPDVEMDGVGE